MDIRCVVCGEPWDSYHMSHDEVPWKARLFRAGAGCPSCEGEAPEGGTWTPETIADVENGDRDPLERLVLSLDVDKRPKWERPADDHLYDCAACGIAVWDQTENEGKEAVYARSASYADRPIAHVRNLYFRGGTSYAHTAYHLERDHDAEGVATGVTLCTGDKVCPECVDYCSVCNAQCCSVLSSDTYDGLFCAEPPGHETMVGGNRMCIDCYEQVSEDEAEDEEEEEEEEEEE